MNDSIYIHPKALVESEVIGVKNGVSIWEGVEIGDRVFIGPNVAFTNDSRPRSKVYHSTPIKTFVLEGASIGANATILPGITIGRYAMIGAGAVVTKDVRDFELVIGNPAQRAGWVNQAGERVESQPRD